MSETAEVTITETPVSVTISGNTPNITIDDSTPQITIYDHSTTITTTISAIPTVTIEADTNITLTADEQPTVVVNTGAGNPYDESTLLAMLADKLTYNQLNTALQADIMNNRDMWNAIGNEIVLLFQDGVDITEANQTYTDTEISSSVTALHVTIDGEVDAKISVVTQTSVEIQETVTDLQQDVDGNYTLQQTQITQNATGITSTVTRLTSLDGPTGLVTQHTSQIAQNDSAITLEITNREALGDDVLENNASIVLNTTDIGLQVSQISSVENRMDTAETNITSQSVINSVNSTLLGTHEYSIEAVETLLANQWSLNIAEDVGGNKYSTGFQLMLHPIWLVDHVYVIDDTIFYDEKIYVCILGHTASTTNNPDGASGATYWSEVVGGYHSEFVVEAEKFQVSIPTESSPVAVFTVSGSTVRINGTLITDTLEAITAYIEMSIQSTNFEEGVEGWQLNKDGTFGAYGEDARLLVGNTVDGEYCEITNGDIDFYYWDGTAHNQHKALKRTEYGIAEDSDVINIPGLFFAQPKIIVSPNTLQTYSATYGAGVDQILQCYAESVEEYSLTTGLALVGTNSWRFTLKTILSASGTAPAQYPASFTGTTSVTSSGYVYCAFYYKYGASNTTPLSCTKITVSGLGKAYASKAAGFWDTAIDFDAYLVIDTVGTYKVCENTKTYDNSAAYMTTEKSFSSFSKTLTSGQYDYSFYIRARLYDYTAVAWSLTAKMNSLTAIFELSTGSQAAAGEANWTAIGQ